LASIWRRRAKTARANIAEVVKNGEIEKFAGFGAIKQAIEK
jgi:hypothetical protein